MIELVTGFSLRPGTSADIDAIVAVDHAATSYPWTRENFEREFHYQWSKINVLCRAEKIIGFMVYWIIADELQILNLAVHPQSQRHGGAKSLMAYALNEAQKAGCKQAILEVRVSNQPAIALYQAHRFKTSTLRKNYYQNGEDALVMSREM